MQKLTDLLNRFSQAVGRIMYFSACNFPLVRVLFMNHFNYKRFFISLCFMGGIVKLRKHYFYRWHMDELAKKIQNKKIQNQNKVTRWSNDLTWINAEGQEKSFFDVEQAHILLVFIQEENLKSLLAQCGDLPGVNVGLMVHCPGNKDIKSTQPGLYLASMTENVPLGNFYGLEIKEEGVQVFWDLNNIKSKQFKGTVRSFLKKLQKRTMKTSQDVL